MKLMSGVFCSFFLFFRAEKEIYVCGWRKEEKSFSTFRGRKKNERVAKWKVKLEKRVVGMSRELFN
jgi:hypothetical protein